jgi:rhodanese-related sulfurtransferase
MERIGPSALRDWLAGDQAPAVVDVREPWEAEICWLPQARLVPMSALPAASGELPSSGPVVVVCHVGMRSAMVAQWLEAAGVSDVYNLAGGLDAWAREVEPEMATY